MLARQLVLAALTGLALAAGGGCGSPSLIATPYVMAGPEGAAIYSAVPAGLRGVEIPIVYVTDRLMEREEPGFGVVYGAGRDHVPSFGHATVRLGGERSWDDLVRASTALEREDELEVTLTKVERRGSLGSLRGQHVVQGGELVYPREALEAFRADLAALAACFDPYLQPGPENEVVLYVHGFNNTFEDAALRLAQVWHALGRRGVPLLYTWPAAFETLFLPFAYNHDRESGEFSTAHLKTLLIALALDPRISGIHLIAHSRGTDVATTTLREIGTEVWSAHGGTSFAQLALGGAEVHEIAAQRVRASAAVAKLRTVVLAAADLDLDVFVERFFTQRVLRLMDRLVIYSSTHDLAIGSADLMFKSDLRLGEAPLEGFDPVVRRLVGGLTSVELIECRLSGVDSHSYVFEHPAALSDLIRVVRDRRAAGAEHGRPLQVRAPGFYVLDDAYLRPAQAE